MMGAVRGRIRPEDIAAVKERTSIEDVVREHVTLRPAGPGSLKGLCPFHDERTPSFTVRPSVGSYHCFGCGEGGDVFSFVEKVDHLTFAETVERLAEKAGLTLVRGEGAAADRRDQGPKRSRLVEAHRVAEEFYAAALLAREDGSARVARDFLREKGFGGEDARRFGVGYAPRGGEDLARHLRDKGFSAEEATTAGLVGRGSRGLYDKFRGRLVWPIRDITGDTIGFGARRLFDDDRMQAKYLNTSETPIYKKSQVLYGLDLAKKSISSAREVVVVEGYTDVMAAHLSGVEGAVATCGTAFGADHIKVLRRILRDEASSAPARVVFTFDGDRAGQEAAMKAFAMDQKWASQSFVAVAEDGMDPNELRSARGDQAVRDLVGEAVPMFEFAVRTTIARFDLATAEGRVAAMKAAAPIVVSIRDSALRPEYVRTVAGWLGVEVEQMQREVAIAAKRPPQSADTRERPSTTTDAVGEPGVTEVEAMPRPNLRDPVVNAERQFLQTVLQYPGLFPAGSLYTVVAEDFSAPAHRAVWSGVMSSGGPQPTLSAAAWTSAVAQAAPVAVAGLVSELAVADLPAPVDKSTGQPLTRYAESLLARLRDAAYGRRIADAMSTLRRLENDPHSDPEQRSRVGLELRELETSRAALREAVL
jgi:DNA primase